MAPPLYPLAFIPIYKNYLWGGDRIARRYQRQGAPAVCAESWEIADHPDGMSVVAMGALRGRSLHELAAEYGPRLLGRRVSGPPYPLLIKIIDARQRLSLQVHPDEESAPRVGGDPKTEMWLALEATPTARVWAGFKQPANAAALQEALAAKRVESLLHAVPLAAGDAVFIPGGRLHAIDAGCLLLEIQQNSNTTYRVYDWERLDSTGRPRPLHLAQALEAIRWDDTADPRIAFESAVRAGRNRIRRLRPCAFFQIEWIELQESLACRNDGASFHALFAARNAVRLIAADEAWLLPLGTSWLLPAALAEYRLQPVERPADVLRISVPPPADR